MDFGNVALAGAFLKPKDFVDEKFYPLKLCFCPACYAVQVKDKIDPNILFKNYFYHSSAIGKLCEHFTHYANKIAERFNPALVVEIGCNDGVMLRPLAEKVEYVIGVDPAGIAKIDNSRITVIDDFFGEAVAKEIVDRYGHADVVIANNVFAHISDIRGVTKAIRDTLSATGVFVFEVHSLDKMIEGGQYDWIYHEHLYYYSFLSLEKHFANYGMTIFDVEPTGLHAGSRRYFVCKDSRPIEKVVEDIRADEIARGLHLAETFNGFAKKAAAHKSELLELLNEIKAAGKKVVGYGACGRANTMIQYCGITHDHMDYIIDDSPVKHGYFTPGSHFEIKSRDTIDSDYLLVFAWSFLEEITKKCAVYTGRAIVPLPGITIRNIG